MCVVLCMFLLVFTVQVVDWDVAVVRTGEGLALDVHGHRVLSCVVLVVNHNLHNNHNIDKLHA